MPITIAVSRTQDAQTYDQRLKAFIKLLEGQVLDVYVDFTGSGKLGNPTIGWGFALNQNFSQAEPTDRNPDALDDFLRVVLGVNPDRQGLSELAKTHEAAYEQALKDVLNQYWVSDPTTNQTGESTLALRQ